jgi:signal transduction histidine kinase
MGTSTLSTTTDHTWLGAELHDLIGHKLSLMVLHASVLEAADGPAAERAALIRQAGHAAILTLRDILARLADGHVPDRPVGSPVAALKTLVGESRDAGLPIGLHTTPDLDELPPDTAELACDVVREALTNVHKHAGIVPTAVTVAVLDDTLVIEIQNQPPATRPATANAGSHRGLDGIRRRIAEHGGQVTDESISDGGFRLYAEVPVDVLVDRNNRG